MKDINKILEKVEYEKRVNEAYTTKIDTEYALVSNKRRLSKLQNIIKLDKSVKFSGFILYFISLLGLVATTSLSIAGGIDRYSGIARTAFIISICFVQLVIFTVSAKESVIKKRFNFHYFKFKLLQAGLLFVSVYFSYEFYIKHIDNPNSILGIAVTILLCCLVDFSTIALVSLAFDKRMLNYSEQDSMETRNIFYMIFYNAMFGIRLRALNQYKGNVRTIRDVLGNEDPETFKTENLEQDSKNFKNEFLEREFKNKFKNDESLEQNDSKNFKNKFKNEFLEQNFKNRSLEHDDTVIKNTVDGIKEASKNKTENGVLEHEFKNESLEQKFKNSKNEFKDEFLEQEFKNNSKILEQEFKNKNLEQDSKKVLEFKTKNIDSKNLEQVKTNDVDSKILEKIKTFLVKNYKEGDRIKKFQDNFALSINEYRHFLKVLKSENIIYTENKNTYMGKVPKEVLKK